MNKKKINEMTMKFKITDKFINEKGSLILLGGYPGVGKSLYIYNIIIDCCINNDKPAGIFSIACNKEAVVGDIQLISSKTNFEKVKNGKLQSEEWLNLSKTFEKLVDSPFYIDDTENISIDDIEKKSRKLKFEEKDLSLIIVDYLQLVNCSDCDDRNQQISIILKRLKNLAVELNLPIIVISQLSRPISSKNPPSLLDLKETSDLKDIPDSILFLHRENYDNKNINDTTAELIIAKNIPSKRGSIKYSFNEPTREYIELNEENKNY